MKLKIEQALQQGVAAHKKGKLQDAERFYRAILQSQPAHPDANHNLGVLAVAINKVDAALPLFKIALDANPKIEQFWLSYISALIKNCQFELARQVVKQAKEQEFSREKLNLLEKQLSLTAGMREPKLAAENKSSSLPEMSKKLAEQKRQNKAKTQELEGVCPSQTQINKTYQHYKNGEYDDAEKLARSITREFPKHQFGWKALSALLQHTGKMSESLVACQKSVQIAPQDEEAHYNLGNTLKELGRLEEAEASLVRAITLKADFAEAHYNLGNTLKELGRFDEAEASYVQAIVEKPSYSEAHYNLSVMLKTLGRMDEAIESCIEAIALEPSYAHSHNHMGVTLQELGRFDEAEASLRQAIELKPDYAEAYNTMGVLVHNLGRLDEAEAILGTAITLRADYAEAHYNLGITLQELGRLDEAEASYTQSIALKPDFAQAHNNLGNTLKELGRLGEAEAGYTQAIALKSDYAEAHHNLSITLKELGRLDDAISASIEALKIDPDYTNAYYGMGKMLKGIEFEKPVPELSELIYKMLEKKILVRPKDVSKAAISLLKFHPIIKGILDKHSKGELTQPLHEIIVDLSNMPLLLKLMEVCPCPDSEFESLFKDIRSAILVSVSGIGNITEVSRFQTALSSQCFVNEYLYDKTQSEIESLKELEALVRNKLAFGKQPAPAELACLASYKALYEYSWIQEVIMPSELRELEHRQIIEPAEEKRLSQKMPMLKKINDNVSIKVREQYEQNSYPRWVNLGLQLTPKSISAVAKEINLNIKNLYINQIGNPQILVAGCGTGQHSIGTATRFKDCNVLAIDLSLSSLSYAKRKTEELGISNIEHMQADILDLEALNRQFDIIESAGVLHHMDNPMAGLQVLTNCLKTGGLMKLGLYSDLARAHIAQMRKEIKRSSISSSRDDMKSFRRVIVDSKEEHHNLISLSPDFYSMSSFRDLLFHVQEHRFTIPKIKDCLAQLGLTFCGFEAERTVQKFKSEYLSENAVYELDKWDAFEKENPREFGSMYQFWCQKVV
ncbi:tetratricopeptide repeat protein [Gammaproteobacteria bacterium]|nr:tetratricopeptide repeat protein [Gammaproteobacteria bacterium]